MTTTYIYDNQVMCCTRMQSSRAENMAGAFEGYFMRLITERC